MHMHMHTYIYICHSWHENLVEFGIVDLIKNRKNRQKIEKRKEKKRKNNFKSQYTNEAIWTIWNFLYEQDVIKHF